MKKSEILLKAMNDIDDAFIEEATVETFRSRDFSFNWKRWMPAMALVLVAVIIGGTTLLREKEPIVTQPRIVCETLQDAEKSAGFPILVPEEYEDVSYDSIVVLNESVITVTYMNDDEKVLTVTKGEGSDDLSGDYNTYSQDGTFEYKGFDVSWKGNEDGIHVATWLNGRYSYAVTVSKGLTVLDLKLLIDEIY